MKINLVLQELDKPNLNGRVYSKEVMEKAIAKYKKDFVDENRALVEKEKSISSCVNLMNVVGKVNEIGIKDGKVVAEIEELCIPGSEEVFKKLKEGLYSARMSGMGTLKPGKDGVMEIQDDYELISIFLTNEPA